MADWVYLHDPATSAHYYADLSTGETCWERPAALDEQAKLLGAREPQRCSVKREPAARWVEYMDATLGIPYYYNEQTAESVWVLPADEDEDEEADEEEAAEEEARREKAARHRERILEEIITTEQTYVASLHTLMKVYLHPLRMVADVPRGAIFSHDDLDAIFLNIEVITKVNDKLLTELLSGVQVADALKAATRQFKGCYTRYVNNYDAAEAKLRKIRESADAGDREKQRYLVMSTSHPDARGKDVTSFLIQPVQRVLRYRLCALRLPPSARAIPAHTSAAFPMPMSARRHRRRLLADLLKHTEESHAEAPAVREAYERVCELAVSFNEDKRVTDDFAKLRRCFSRFVDGDAMSLRNELLSYERKLLREGTLVKVRLSHRQRHTLFLFNDVLLYAAPTMKGCALKGRIRLHDGARVESLPRTEEMPHAFAIVDRGGKGYTWLCESAEEKEGWLGAVKAAITDGAAQARHSRGFGLLAHLPSKPLDERLEAVRVGGTLTKYNKADGKSKLRWVCVVRSTQGHRICWGDQKTRDCKSDMRLSDASALLHGAKSSNFFKMQGSKKDADWQCFSIVFQQRTLDFAATTAAQLLDWYLALASLLPQSTEPLLDEPTLRQHMETMGLGAAEDAAASQQKKASHK